MVLALKDLLEYDNFEDVRPYESKFITILSDYTKEF